MPTSCLEKQEEVKKLFAGCTNQEAKYQQIMKLGRELAPLETRYKVPANMVEGCQSTVYLSTEMREGVLIFNAASDALISAGLAALLIAIYSGETPEAVLQCPPSCLDELEIGSSLSPNRANGLYSIHLRMKKEALQFLMGRQV